MNDFEAEYMYTEDHSFDEGNSSDEFDEDE